MFYDGYNEYYRATHPGFGQLTYPGQFAHLAGQRRWYRRSRQPLSVRVAKRRAKKAMADASRRRNRS